MLFPSHDPVTGSGPLEERFQFNGATAALFWTRTSLMILDSPASTSSLTYKVQGANHDNSNSGSVIFQAEIYTGSAWSAVGGGATGAGGDQVFVENDQSVDNDYTISTNRNAMSTGPITIASGVTVTVPSGSNWVVL